LFKILFKDVLEQYITDFINLLIMNLAHSQQGPYIIFY